MNPMSMLHDAEKLTVQQLQQSIQNGVLPAYIGVPLLQEKVKQQALQQQALQQPQQQTPVAQQVMQAAQQMQPPQGIDALESDDVAGYAAGGTVGYATGGVMSLREQLEAQQENIRKIFENNRQKAQDEKRAKKLRYAREGRQSQAIRDARYVGYTPEELAAYEPADYAKYKQLTNRSLIPYEGKGLLLDDFNKLNQTGVGIKGLNTIEMPPEHAMWPESKPIEPIRNQMMVRPNTGLSSIPEYIPEPQLPANRPYTPSGMGEYVKNVNGEWLGAEAPSSNKLSTNVRSSPVYNGASFEIPRSTPNADIEAAKEYYRTQGPRPMNAGQAREQALRNAESTLKGTLKGTDTMAGPKAMRIARLGIPLGIDSQLIQELAMPGLTAYDYKDPTMRSKIQSLFGMKHINETAPESMYDSAARKSNDIYNKYFGEPELAQPQRVSAQGASQIAPAQITPMQARDMAKQGYKTPFAPQTPQFDFADPEAAARGVLSDPAKATTDPELYQWATNYQKEHPVAPAKTPADRATPIAVMPSSNYADLLTPEKTADQYRAERAAALGTNAGIDSLRGELSRMKEGTEKEQDKAGWLALMQAGLATMGGTSPNALTNIAQGAQTGFAAYGKAQDKFDRAQDKYFEYQAKLEDAQRREQEAAYKYGEESAQRDKASNLAIKMAEKKEQAAINMESIKENSPLNKAHINLYDAQAASVDKPSYGIDKQAMEARVALQAVNDELQNLIKAYEGRPAKLAVDPHYQELLRMQKQLRRQHALKAELDPSIYDTLPLDNTPPPGAKIIDYTKSKGR